MKNSKLIAGILFVLLTSMSTAPILGQTAETPEIASVKTHIINSIYNKKEYCIDVLLPKSYSTADTIKYPVLYVLDGKYSTGLFYSVIEIFGLAKEVKDLIIVSIDGNVQSESDWLTGRYHDYTPSCNPESDTAIAKFFNIPVIASGGAPAFLSTLKNEIIPFIEQQYKASDERGLYGHSLGGLFAGYCLVTMPDLFQKYSINSPSFWWNNGEMTTEIGSLAIQNQKITAEIFISAGALEGEFMIAPVIGFVESLRNNFPDTNITSKIFNDETHLSVVPMVCSRTLKIFYAQTSTY